MVKGYVAFLDILGFTAIVASETPERIDRYLDFLKAIFERDGSRFVDYVVFSDSIIITTHDDTDASLQELLKRCSALFGGLLVQGIPVRGAISHGSFITSKTQSGTFVAGRAIIEAYQFEEKQNWVGIMLAPSVIAKKRDIRNLSEIGGTFQTATDFQRFVSERKPWAAFVQFCERIPFHGTPLDDPDYEGLALVPTRGEALFPGMKDTIDASIQALSRLKAIAPDPQAQAKYQRSILWLLRVAGSWRHAEEQREIFEKKS
jgi:hypothetical protein